ncbi:hypothetical protein MBLNU230_g4492t1 [Neophaeotheca triangularis]
MEVQLYVYDLTHGMARSMSQQLLGIHIDAVYHTSLVFEGIEYFFGAGVQTCYAGSTHHGRPMEIVSMGTTDLPLETIFEYLESLKTVYTPESYDLFAHNCNNFTNDFGMFLVGKGIPAHITSLPKRVLETPFGQMLKPQIEAGMRGVTQSPVPPQNVPSKPSSSIANGGPRPSQVVKEAQPTATAPLGEYGRVLDVHDVNTLRDKLATASTTAATIFFTSSTCAPCKMAYPTFDQLAEQYPNALFVKVDINSARDIAAFYQIRATPTFMTFARGSKQDEWQGADPRLLRTNVEQLMQTTFPPHPHTRSKVATLQFGSLRPISYTKVPPLDKLTARLGEAGSKPEIVALRTFIAKRAEDPREAPLPDLQAVSNVYTTQVLVLNLEVRFAAVDLLRCALVDPRASGFFAEQQGEQVIPKLIEHVNSLEECPHNLRLVTLHLACNLFLSQLYTTELLKQGNILTNLLVQLITTSLLDHSHPTTRVAAASLAFNLASSNYRVRREESREGITEGGQVELAASLLETLSGEESADASKTELTALGYLVYCSPEGGEVLDLCEALDAKATVNGVKEHEALRRDVASLLLTKGKTIWRHIY